MISEHNQRVADRAKAIYDGRLRAELELQHRDKYVAIEPDSGDHFLAESFGQAVAAAQSSHPGRISFVVHIGHQAAIHIGGMAN